MSRRQKLLRYLLLFVLLVPVFNLLTVLLLPTVINQVVLHRIVEQGLRTAAETVSAHGAAILARGAVNIALPAQRADASARTVVRPSPDLLYTACVFDLSHGPLLIEAPVPESYLSVSGFAADSSNFFARNDHSAVTTADGSRWLRLVLFRDGQPPVAADMPWVQAPSTRGLVLFRLLIDRDEALPRLRSQYQAQQRCQPLASAPPDEAR